MEQTYVPTYFQEIVNFCRIHENVFKTFQEATEAYSTFLERKNRKASEKEDKLLTFAKKYQKVVRTYLWETKNIGRYSDIYGCNHYKLSDVMRFLKKHKYMVDGGIFDSRNTVGDEMRTVYEKEGVIIDYAPYYEYVEIFGLREGDFEKLYEEFAEPEEEL